MSSGVAQVKKRFGEFETYLRKDTEGLRRLKLLKDDVNVLRTSLAAAQAERDAAVSSMEVARQRADKAEIVAAEIREENRRLKDQNISMRSQLESMRRLQASDDNIDEADAIGCGNEYASASGVVQRLRRLLPQCPDDNGAKAYSRSGSMHFYMYREDIAKGWSHNDIWIIGAATAVLSAVGGVTVVAKRKITDIIPDGLQDSGLSMKCLKWCRSRIDMRNPTDIAKEDLSYLMQRTSLFRETSEDATAEGLGL